MIKLKNNLKNGLYLCYWKQDEFHRGYMLANYENGLFTNANPMGGTGQISYIIRVKLLDKHYD